MSPPIVKGYQISEEIMRDNNGVIWLAVSEESGEEFALREFFPETIEPPRVYNSLVNLATRPSHPGIGKIFNFNMVGERPFAVMELFADQLERDNGSTYREMRTLESVSTSLSRLEAWRYIYQIADALAYLHRHRIVHSGLQLSNVLLDDSRPPKIKITGFGEWIARGDDIGEMIPYAAPEQLRNPDGHEERDAEKWDVYAFGVIAFRLLTGEFPRMGDFLNEYHSRRAWKESAITLNLHTCAEILESEATLDWPSPPENEEDQRRHAIIEACLALDPDDRYVDMREVRDVFSGMEDRLAHEADLAELEEIKTVTIRKLTGVRRVALVSAVAAISAGALAAWTQFGQSRNFATNNPQNQPETPASGEIRVAPAFGKALPPQNTAYLEKLQGLAESVDSIFGQLASTGATELLPEGTRGQILSYYQDFAEENAKDPQLVDQVSRANLIAGEMLLELGDPSEASKAVTASIAQLATTASENDPVTMVRAANAHQLLAKIHVANRLPGQALDAQNIAHEFFQKILDRNPSSPTALRLIAHSQHQLSDYQLRTGNTALASLTSAAGEKYLEQLAEAAQLSDEDTVLAASYEFLNAEINRKLGLPEDAVTALISSIDILLILSERSPTTLLYRFHLARSYGALAEVLAEQGDRDASTKANDQAIGILGQLSMEVPSSVAFREELAHRFASEAGIFRDVGKGKEAILSQEKVVALWSSLLQERPKDSQFRLQYGLAQRFFAVLHAESGKVEIAVDSAQESIKAIQNLLVEDLDAEHGNRKRLEYRRELGISYELSARLMERTKRNDHALKCYEKAIEHWEQIDSPDERVVKGLTAAQEAASKLRS